MKRPLVLGMVLVVSAALALAQQEAAPAAAAQQAAPNASAVTPDANDPLFGVPPLPAGNTSLLGGIVQKIDRVRERVTVQPFGDSKKMTVQFDERTHIYRDGVEVTERGIQRGDRVYVDTMEDEGRPFARNIRVVTHLQPANARGQIVSYDSAAGIMTVRDQLSAQPVTFRITQDTSVKGAGTAARDLVPGTLVAVHFSPDTKIGVASEVSVLAVPGTSFTFIGTVRHLDLRSGILVIENRTDNKTYDLQFQPGVVGDNVMVGSDVSVSALFDGNAYQARTVRLNEESSRQ